MGQAIDGCDFAKKLIEAGIIPKDLAVQRIAVDIRCDEPVTVYYETFADTITLDVCLETLMANKKELNIKQVERVK